MIKKEITYVNYNEETVTETLYFNLTKPELTKMEFEREGGLSAYMEEAVKSGDNAKILELFDKILLKAYGVKSEDGKRFIKSPTLSEEFSQSMAYVTIFNEFLDKPETAHAFMEQIMA